MNRMVAMQIPAPGKPLEKIERAIAEPGPGEVLIQVSACGVCRTDLHVLDGEIPANYPIIPGHEIVGRVVAVGPGADALAITQRVGVAWLGHVCGQYPYCRAGRENLCDAPLFTGATHDGGYATHVIADARYCLALPDRFSDIEVAPLLCAGLIGWRATRRLSGFTALVPPPIFWRRWRARKGAPCMPSPRMATIWAGFRPVAGLRLGGRRIAGPAGIAGCRLYLRAGRRSGSYRPACRSQGRQGRLRGHPYERYPVLSLC